MVKNYGSFQYRTMLILILALWLASWVGCGGGSAGTSTVAPPPPPSPAPPPTSPPSNPGPQAADFVTIYNTSGASQNNYAISVPRVFRQGELSQFAQAVIGGNAVTTQCDVKNRWSDGSLKFAVVSFVIPNLPSGSSVQVSFQNQSTGNNTSYLDVNGMLDPAFDFEGTINVDNGGGITHSSSARAMLSAGKFSYWLKGPIVTAVRIADHFD